ncbi:MAG: FAD-binding protein [Candidatus Heimdallarchaeota archaeon]|nr:FAD-binding protein [Candidatus Heimdallarchaeota archaeon]
MDFEIIFDKKAKSYDKKKVYQKLVQIFGKKNVSKEAIDQFAYSKDYTLITTRWTLDGKLAARPDFIVWPETTEQIAELLLFANNVKTPVIPFGSGSGVVGGALPIFGGILVDMKRMDQIIEINEKNLTVTLQTGKNGMNIERELNQAGYTLGHIPQSIFTSTLGGYIAHRAAGQFSTKYGKIEDMLISLEAVVPTGEIIRSKPSPANSVGPQLDRLLIGAEGTLGIVTEATLRIWPFPEKKILLAYAFNTIEDALDATREILQAQAFPAVIRIYDKEETARHFPEEKKAKNRCMTVFVCTGYSSVVETEAKVTQEMCANNNGIPCGEEPVHHWFETRFNVTESSTYPPLGIVADTIEVSVMWDNSAKLYHNVIKAMKEVKGTLLATGHASHFYPQGICFYFTFGGEPIDQSDYDYYQAVWNACMEATIEAGGSISHHHGIGINRSHWMKEEWGTIFPVLKKIKQTLDPKNIMNPGKLYEGKVEEER